MPYVKTNWQNKIPGVQAGTKVNATNMNNIEKGIVLTNSQSEVKTAGGSATAITISDFGLDSYFTGLKVTFVAAANNGGAATTINIDGKGAKNIYKPNTVNAPNFIAGKAYTIYYNGTSFFWQASAEGNAVVAQVLAGATFSNDNDTGLVGTMINRSTTTYHTLASEIAYVAAGTLPINGGALNVNPIVFYKPPLGYYDGTSWVYAEDPDLVASNIKKNINIYGLVGTAEVINFVPGTVTLIFANPGNGQTTSYTTTATLTPKYNGTYRVSYKLASNDTSWAVSARLWNATKGIMIGTERTNVINTSGVLYTEDLTIEAGDVIQLQCKVANAVSYWIAALDQFKFMTTETFKI